MSKMFLLGFKFVLNDDYYLNIHSEDSAKKGSLCEVIEIDDSDSDELCYKVEIENYENCWEWISEDEIIGYADGKVIANAINNHLKVNVK